MLEFPYMQLPGGVFRPIIAVILEGPNGWRLLDGLLDTGADRTIFPQREAKAVGIALPVQADGILLTASGGAIALSIGERYLGIALCAFVRALESQRRVCRRPLAANPPGHAWTPRILSLHFHGPGKKDCTRPSPLPAACLILRLR